MIRDIITNKWILISVALLIISVGACYLWYQHEITPYKQNAAKNAELRRQWEATRKANSNNKVEPEVNPQSMENTTQDAANPTTETPGPSIETDTH